jgi:hypothetical protein
MTDVPTILDAARDYLRRGFLPVPIPVGQKRPVLRGWNALRLKEEELPKHFGTSTNIGLILGEPSGWLVNVDLDCVEARALASDYLPPTPVMTGRASTPGSHRWYVAPGVATAQHKDPVDRRMIVELRSTGGQTVVGPSIHPSGESYECLNAEPAHVPAPMLTACVAALAQAVIRARHGDAPSQKPATVAQPRQSSSSNDVERRAIAYLEKLPPAISGQGGHAAAYTAAVALVHGMALDPERAVELLLAHYNPRCEPPWTEKELRHKVDDAAKKPHDKPFGWLRDAQQPETRDVDLRPLLAKLLPANVATDNEPAPDLPEDPGQTPDHLLHIPGFIQEVMSYTLETAQYPEPVLAFCGALTLQALLAGRKVRDASDNRTNLYVLGLANSGAGKDHPRKVNQKILLEAGWPECLGDHFASGEGIQDRLFGQPAVLFQTDEIDLLMKAINSAKDARHEGILQVLLKMYTSANALFPMRVKAGGEQGVIDQPCLCLFGTAIPKHFYEALSLRMLTNGFFARLLILDSRKRSKGQDGITRDVPASLVETARWWIDFQPGEHRHNLSQWHPVPRLVEQTPEAGALLREFRDQADTQYSLAEERGEQAAMAIWARAHEKARRLALIYACSANHVEPLISANGAHWAREFVDHQTRRMLYMASQHASENEFDARCKRLVEVLAKGGARHPEGWMPFWMINRKLPWSEREHEEVRNTLLNQRVIEYQVASSGGRPGMVYRLARTS